MNYIKIYRKPVLMCINILIFILFIQNVHSQWMSNYSGNSIGDVNLSNAHGNAITVDNNEKCYVTGYVNENNGQGNNILIIKYNSETGDTIWVRTFNGTANGDDNGEDIKVDQAGNVYVTGSVNNLSTGSDAVILKFNSEGDLLWSKSYNGSNTVNSEDVAKALAFDRYGNIYLTGYCTGDDLLFDILLIKYNSEGERIWIKREDGTEHLNAQGINVAVDKSGYCIYVIGYITRSATKGDICLIKYFYNSYPIYVKYLSGSSSQEDRAFGIVVDEADNIYVTGYTTYDAVTGKSHSVTTKLNSYGNEQWTRVYGGSTSDRAFGIVVDETDKCVYITGYITDSYGSKDYLTVAYNSIGNLLWDKFYNGPVNGDDEASAIGILENSNSTKSIIVTGSSTGSNNNKDYTTLKYSKEGALLAESRYSMTTQTDDVPKDLVIDIDNNVFVTGFSQLLGDGPTPSSSVSTVMLNLVSKEKIKPDNSYASGYELHQNYPNPFNPTTNISFSIPNCGKVKLVIYDVTGQIVSTLVNDILNAGTYEISFNAKNMASGIYFYEISVGNFRDIKKMTLIK